MAVCKKCGKEIPSDRRLCEDCFNKEWDLDENSDNKHLNEWKVENSTDRRTGAS